MFTPSLMCSGKAANAIDVGMIEGRLVPRRRVLGGGNETRRRGKLYAATKLAMPFKSDRNVMLMRQWQGIDVPLSCQTVKQAMA